MQKDVGEAGVLKIIIIIIKKRLTCSFLQEQSEILVSLVSRNTPLSNLT